ncbi:hypothetical protein HMPREF0208_01093 [Citrobacter koseri]|nr:hypothetical protein HMPREF3207_01565 [Citrobacter koseri]KXB45645.1 hypothetical protein HMPREF0208_01093 [Citrobacter koseri]
MGQPRLIRPNYRKTRRPDKAFMPPSGAMPDGDAEASYQAYGSTFTP